MNINGIEILKDNTYLWSGKIERYITIVIWERTKCKILDVEDDYITVFDYDDYKSYRWEKKYLKDSCKFEYTFLTKLKFRILSYF